MTFSTGIPDVPLPFGSDRKLLAWVFDRAINSESPVIGWESTWEYQKELGLKRSGKNNRDRFVQGGVGHALSKPTGSVTELCSSFASAASECN